MDSLQRNRIFHSASLFHAPEGQAHHKPLHQHPQTAEILLITEGQGRIIVNGKPYAVRSGMVVLYNAGDWHEELSNSRSSFKGLALCSSGEVMKGLPLGHVRPIHLAPIQKLKEFTKLLVLLTDLINENSSTHSNKQTTVQLLQDLFLEILDRSLRPEICTAAPDQYQHIRMAQHFIEETCHTEMTLERLSAEIGLSKYYLARLFKEHLGVSPIQYAIQCRLRTAQQLLATTSDPIADIAKQTGYKSETHFQQAFKKGIGATPGTFRKQAAMPLT